MGTSLKKRIETYLYHKGFTDPVLRGVMLVQLVICAFLLVAGAVAFWFTGFVLQAFIGAALMTFNFWFLSLFIFRHFYGGYSRDFLAGQLLRFIGRFALTGAVLVAVAILGGSPVAVCAGIVCCVAASGAVALLGMRNSRA
ncbi:hypothetical protein LJC48_01850 [Desulfovibrio sp. OttesenSCG-928-C06]|nr:hypothetical protein [Desulfovibrio sp. OttesenSCG-928-C06]